MRRDQARSRRSASLGADLLADPRIDGSPRPIGYKNLYKLTIAGGVAFWATNFATSLLPIAAEYRAALSISYVPMVLVESLLGGLIIGCCVSNFLLRSFDQIPTKDPVLKSEILSIVALLLATIMTGVTASRLEQGDVLHYFLIGAMLNVPRFLILGMVIGYLYKRLDGSASPAARADQVPS